jgi:hypothetical protein
MSELIEGMAKTVCEVRCAASCDKPCWQLEGCTVAQCQSEAKCGDIASAIQSFLADPQNVTPEKGEGW